MNSINPDYNKKQNEVSVKDIEPDQKPNELNYKSYDEDHEIDPKSDLSHKKYMFDKTWPILRGFIIINYLTMIAILFFYLFRPDGIIVDKYVMIAIIGLSGGTMSPLIVNVFSYIRS